MSNKIYPIGIQSFEKIRRNGYFYIDKTALIYRLVKTGSYYFLSRPRRFGKSLLISTLEAYFSGVRELFEGLDLEQLEKEWKKHPVLHLDLNIGKYDTPHSLDDILNKALLEWEAIYGTGVGEVTLALRFAGVVERAYKKTGEGVVILVDEYDKPMLQAIGERKLQVEFRSTLKSFYSVLKTMDRYIRFALLTGVTKFGKVSVFSDLNNLNDISMYEPFVSICGIRLFEIFAGGYGCFFNVVAFVYVVVHFQSEFPSGGGHKLPQSCCSCRRAGDVVQVTFDYHQVFEVVGDAVGFQYRFYDGEVSVGTFYQ